MQCLIWGTPAIEDMSRQGDYTCVNSPRAGGKYWIDGRAVQFFRNLNNAPESQETERKKARLTTWLIEQRRLGIDRPKIYHYEIDEVFRRPDMMIQARIDQFLKYIRDKSPHIGSQFEFVRNDEHQTSQELLAFTESTTEEELEYLINHLLTRDWLNKLSATFGYIEVEITVDGYSRLAEMENIVTVSSRAFVAMWFDESMNQAWEVGIKPGIEDAGYEAVRVDQQEHVNKVDDQIISEINRSRFVVADFTQGSDGARGGVYYEAGYAHGIGIPVIFMCRSDTLTCVHFDTRQYNHIIWEDLEELRKNLANRISAVIGDGPRKHEESPS